MFAYGKSLCRMEYFNENFLYFLIYHRLVVSSKIYICATLLGIYLLYTLQQNNGTASATRHTTEWRGGFSLIRFSQTAPHSILHSSTRRVNTFCEAKCVFGAYIDDVASTQSSSSQFRTIVISSYILLAPVLQESTLDVNNEYIQPYRQKYV